MDAPLALYRRYRPDTFEAMIGQDHVTQPLSNALDNNRVHHAYLFSGPHGCGKTTSARIMARALNCEKGPTSTPCGSCESCQELATGGPGSIDVIEIDAASHGGVDDTRDLREKAMFGPMKARYKVYIIDEAHMVSTQGFNALLKLVEEPPAHLRFIFATTEPEKVIGTIKSRTHHYPFRLVPPKVLGDYLIDLCGREEVPIEPTVVPLVVRAGAGSVRDSLSVLDQLIGGAGPDGVTYPLATALLGYTPDSLLDETIDALAAGDGATVFGVVDKVIDSGQDPRRFAEDLLHRLRDLVVLSVVPDAASRGLLEIADDQADRLAGQSARFGRAELTRAADIVSEGLTEMRGATAPRLLLELICARILLPGIDQSAEGLGARIERLERRLSMSGEPAGASSEAAGTATGQRSSYPSSPPRQPAAPAADNLSGDASQSAADERAGGRPVGELAEGEPVGAAATDTAGGSEQPEQVEQPEQPEQVEADQAAPAPMAAGAAAAGRLGLVDVRRLWPGVLDRVKAKKKYAWMLLSQNAQVKDLERDTLTIAFASAGPCKNFTSGDAGRVLQEALVEELGVEWRVESIIDGGSTSPASAATGRPAEASEAAGAGSTAPAGVATPGGSSSESPQPADPAATGASGAANGGAGRATSEASTASAGRSAADRSAGRGRKQSTSSTSKPADLGRADSGGAPPASDDEGDALPHRDDEVVDDPALTSQELLARELGAQLIDETPTP